MQMTTIDFDITWQNPSKAQMAAFGLAVARKPRGLTEFDTAALICLSQESLWYHQAKTWAESPPEIGNGKVIWQMACKFIVEIVDLDYDPEKDMWWDLSRLGFGTPKDGLPKLLLLMDFGVMLKQYRAQSTSIISAGFEPFIDLVCGPGWEKRYRGVLEKITQAVEKKIAAAKDGMVAVATVTSEITGTTIHPCINPYCAKGENGQWAQVDTRKRRSGACCKECMNYECTHPQCVARAQANGWPKATHPWGSKIAQEHLEYRKV